ncbi:hypothetical protein ADUPG1_001544, partial [Aduncisulcus paluster]
ESETVVIRDLKSKKDKRVTAARIIPFDDARMSLDDMVALTELDSSEYIVEEIVSHRYTSAGKMPMVERYTFEVVWLGWPNPTWEEYRYIVKTPAFREYCRSRPELQRVYANKMKATKPRKKRKSRFALDEESESSEDSHDQSESQDDSSTDSDAISAEKPTTSSSEARPCEDTGVTSKSGGRSIRKTRRRKPKVKAKKKPVVESDDDDELYTPTSVKKKPKDCKMTGSRRSARIKAKEASKRSEATDASDEK